MAAGGAVGNGVAPPLQANLAERRVTDHVADACHFGVEGVEREEVLAQRRRRE